MLSYLFPKIMLNQLNWANSLLTLANSPVRATACLAGWSTLAHQFSHLTASHWLLRQKFFPILPTFHPQKLIISCLNPDQTFYKYLLLTSCLSELIKLTRFFFFPLLLLSLVNLPLGIQQGFLVLFVSKSTVESCFFFFSFFPPSQRSHPFSLQWIAFQNIIS